MTVKSSEVENGAALKGRIKLQFLNPIVVVAVVRLRWLSATPASFIRRFATVEWLTPSSLIISCCVHRVWLQTRQCGHWFFFCRSSSSTQLNVVVISFSDEHKHIFGPCIPFLSCLQVHGKATFGFPCGVCPKELCDSVDFPLETNFNG